MFNFISFQITALVTATILAAPAHAQNTLPVQEGFPADFKVDGEIKEWESTVPTLVMDSRNRAHGEPKESDEFSAKIWIAISNEGLTLAGSVNDTAMYFPGYTKEWNDSHNFLNSDHIEVWLAFPGLPEEDDALVLNGEPFDAPGWCDDKSNSEQCQEWVEGEKYMRPVLRRLHIRQFVIAESFVREVYFREVAPLPPGVPGYLGSNCKDAGQLLQGNAFYGIESSFRKTESGYTWEAFIPAEVFPATTQMPLRNFRMLVDVVDNDEDFERQERFYSSSTKRKFGRPETYNTVMLVRPLDFNVHSLMQKIYQGMKSVLFVPAQKNAAFFYEKFFEDYESDFGTPWGGYEHSGTELYKLSFPSQPIASYHDVRLHQVPWPGFIWPHIRQIRLVAVKADGRFSVYQGEGIGGWCGVDSDFFYSKDIMTVERGGALHVVMFCDGSVKMHGGGQCGACPSLTIKAFSLDKEGNISHLFSTGADDWAERGIRRIIDDDKTCFGALVYSNSSAQKKYALDLNMWCWDEFQKAYVDLSSQPEK